MLVMKFGGTSVGSAEAIIGAANIVRNAVARKPIVIVSAVAGVTNSLIEMANAENAKACKMKFESIRRKHEEVLESLGFDAGLLDAEFDELESLCEKHKKITKASLDHYVSFGERLSAKIFAEALKKIGIDAKAFPAWEIGMTTDDVHGGAEPLAEAAKEIDEKLKKLKEVPVITGYIGKSKKGVITTLGRGGSDYSAAIIGAAIKAEAIQIWKEVDGIMSTDPRIVPEARVLPELAFEEAAELAYFGAKVLHPRTILPAMKAGVPVQVLNTFKPEGRGTTIVANFEERREKSRAMEAIAFKKGASIVHIASVEFFDGSDQLSDIFAAYHKHRANVDVVALSVAGVSLAMDTNEVTPELLKEFEKIGTVSVTQNKAIVCAVGGSIDAAGVAGKMFTILGQHEIPTEMISQAASGYSITFVVDEKDAEKALKTLHKEYIEDTGASS